MVRKIATRFAPSTVILGFATALAVVFGTHAALAQTPMFFPAVTYMTGIGSLNRGTNAVVAADVNGDGRLDVIMSNDGGLVNGSVVVLLGNGDGTFQPPLTYDSGGSAAVSVAVADVNADHKPDIMLAHCGYAGGTDCMNGSFVSVLLGNGDGTFQAPVHYPSGGIGGLSIRAADVNGDGAPDLIVSHNTGDGITPEGNVAVLLGNGDGSFKSPLTYDSGGAVASSVAVKDVNGDGRPDLLVANQCDVSDCFGHVNGRIGVLLGNGDGTFQPVVVYGAGDSLTDSIAVEDINGDGKPDLLVANSGSNTVGVLLGNGDGTFKPVVTYSSGFGAAYALAVRDVNGDGNPDVLVTHFFDGTLGLLLGNGDGTFQTAVTYDAGGSSPGSVAIADVNGDGKPDLLVSECSIAGCGIGDELGVLLNNTPFDTTPPVITISATPKVLWPPNGKRVPVTVSGTIIDTGSGVNANSAAYSVKDEYGEVQPTGAIALGPQGNYSFTVLLQASRRGSDLDGRRYRITVRAKDNAGNGGSKTGVVSVPHDQSN